MPAARLISRARYAAAGLARKVVPALAVLALLALPVSAETKTETLRLVAFGDSLTQGYGLPQGKGLVPQLQRWLDTRDASAHVVNMGVSGDTTTGGRARLDWALAEGADAVMLELGGNDLLRGIPLALTRENLDAILATLKRRDIPVLMLALGAPLNFGADYRAGFKAIYADLARRYDVALDPAFMSGIRANPKLMQPDMLHPNPKGVARIVERIGPAVLELLERARQ